MKKREILIVTFIGALLVVVFMLVTQFTQRAPDTPPQTDTPPAQQVPEGDGELTRASCTQAGGTWNACGSACRGADEDTACVQVCVEQCECTSNDQCPSGFSCTEFVDGIGICK